MLEFLKRALPAFVLALTFTFGMYVGSTTKEAEWKQEVHNEYVKKDEARKSTQAAVDEISSKYQEDYAALEGSTDRTIADLHLANKRLSLKVKATSGAITGDGRCIVDGRVELQDSDAKALIGLAERADLKERALQDTIRKLQQKEK